MPEKKRPAEWGPKVAVVSLCTSLFLGISKILAGTFGHSRALVADGIESSIDFCSYFLLAGALWFARRPADENHPYGHGKAESLAAFCIALAMMAVAGILGWKSLGDLLWDPPADGPRAFTLLVLVIVIVIKEALFRFFKTLGDTSRSQALVAHAWDHRADAVISLAAFAGISISLWGGSDWRSADPAAALLACGIIAFNAARLVRPALRELLDEAPPTKDFELQIRKLSQSVEGVACLEKCRIRKSGTHYWLEVHVQVDGSLSVDRGHSIGHAVRNKLVESDLGVADALVHVEPCQQKKE